MTVAGDPFRAIVEKLAACGDPEDNENGDCVLCGEYLMWHQIPGGQQWQREKRLTDHAMNCPYRMAVEVLR